MRDRSTGHTGLGIEDAPVASAPEQRQPTTDRLAVPQRAPEPTPEPTPAPTRAAWATFAVRHRRATLVLLGYLTAAVVLTARLWADPAGLRVAGNPGDITQYQWWFGWWLHALSTFEHPFTTYAMNMPTGINLMSNTSMALPALASSWLFVTAGPLVTYNVLTTLAPALSGWGAYLAAGRLGVRPAAAIVGGLVFGFSPAIVHSLVGHLSMAMALLLPILILLNIRAWRTQRPRRVGLALGAAAFAQLMTGEEVLFQAGLGTLIVLVVVAVNRPALIRPALPVAARAYGWSMVVFLPLAAYPLYHQFFGPLRQHGSPFWVDYFAADLGAFTTAPELVWLGAADGAADFPGGVPEHLAYLGWPLLIFCLATVATRWSDLRVRVAGVGLVVAGLLSLGGTLWVRGEQTKQQLPWGWLKDLPILESALPSRFGLLAALFAAALLAFGLDALLTSAPSRARRVVAGLSAVAILVTLLPRLLPVETVPDVPRYFTEQARDLPAGTAVLIVPFPRPEQTIGLAWQTAARYSYAAPGGYFIAPAGDGHAYIGGAAGTTQKLLVAAEEKGEVKVVTPKLRATVRAELVRWGIDVAVLGPSGHQRELRVLLTQLFEQEPQEIGGVMVWDRPAR